MTSEAHTVHAGRILICDDSATIRLLLHGILTPTYECMLVASGEAALAACHAFQPDLVITDLQMGGMTGLELCTQLGRSSATADIPVIMLTIHTAQEEREVGLEAGVADYLFKPVRERELMARVRSLLKLRRATQGLQTRTQQLERANADLKQLHATAMQRDKLATMGTLAAGLAHEINNPLGFMRSGIAAMLESVEQLQKKAGDPNALLIEMQQIGVEVNDGLQRIARIVRDLRECALEPTSGVEDTCLVDEVERAWKMSLMHASASKMKPMLEMTFPATFHLRTVRHQIGQVLLNLFLNSIQAMEGDGTVSVGASQGEHETVLRVSDTGPGIPFELRERVFEPFFTTKAPGQGTGLGLAVTYGIVRTLGGTIQLGTPERGASFELHLPT